MPERHSERNADVLIVGAGIAGLSLAIALSKSDLNVVVIDGADRPKPVNEGVALDDWDLRVSALTPTSIHFLESLGVWQKIPNERTAPYESMCVGMPTVLVESLLMQLTSAHPTSGTLSRTDKRCRR